MQVDWTFFRAKFYRSIELLNFLGNGSFNKMFRITIVSSIEVIVFNSSCNFSGEQTDRALWEKVEIKLVFHF